MAETYTPTPQELKLQAQFVIEGSMHTWGLADKIAYIGFVNKKAGLPFGTIGLLHTESKKGEVKEIPYATRQTTVELARQRNISVTQQVRDITDKLALFVYRAKDIETGREVDATGACSLTYKDGNQLADYPNKIMHAETKAKRRATLEICGLAFLDESEVADMEGAKVLTLGGEPAKEEKKTVDSDAASSKETVGKPAGTTSAPPPAAEPPKLAIVPTVPPAVPTAVAPPVPVSTFDGPERYKEQAALFAGADDAIANSRAHMALIVSEATEKCGWSKADMSTWLHETFGVHNKNTNTALTVAVFKRIMGGIDSALTAAGR